MKEPPPNSTSTDAVFKNQWTTEFQLILKQMVNHVWESDDDDYTLTFPLFKPVVFLFEKRAQIYMYIYI